LSKPSARIRSARRRRRIREFCRGRRAAGRDEAAIGSGLQFDRIDLGGFGPDEFEAWIRGFYEKMLLR
jgi:hypothetical protein